MANIIECPNCDREILDSDIGIMCPGCHQIIEGPTFCAKRKKTKKRTYNGVCGDYGIDEGEAKKCNRVKK